MNKSNTEKDKLIFSYTNNQNINLPIRYTEMIESTLTREKNRNNPRFLTQKRVAIFALFFLCMAGTGAYASSNYILKRQQQLSDSAVEQYVTDIQNSGADADNFSRDLSQKEQERFTQLEKAYTNEGVFPERNLLVVDSENEIDNKRVCFLAKTSTFYLPIESLSDEDLLELIDFRYMREYSLSKQENVTTEQTSTEPPQNSDIEDIAMQMVTSLFNTNAADLLIQGNDFQTIKEGEHDFSQEHISIFNQANQIQYTITVDVKTKQVASIDLAGPDSNYADGISEDIELEQSLYATVFNQNEIFTQGQYTVNKCFIQTAVDNSSGNLQHGIVNYCFEMDQDMISVISYSYATKTFYQYRMFTQEGFEEWKNKHIEQCKKNNLKFDYTEIK